MEPENAPAAPAPAAPSHSIPKDAIDPDALRVLQRLQREGFSAYLVGGCVRDLLLGIRPKDFDVATDARPRQVKRLFRNSRIIGRRFRLAHVHFGPRVIEVATFRRSPEQEGEDLLIERDNVFGTETEDAFRRDFTINGLFYDPIAERLVDHVGGLADLDARVIRTIGDAETRVREDPVRILRAAKFAGRLDFQLAPDLVAAARAHAQDLRKSAPPRVLEELYRLVSGRGAARAWRLLDELGAVEAIAPELTPAPAWFLEALERLESVTGGSREGAPQALLAAVLLAPAAVPRLRDLESGDPESAAQTAFASLARRLTISRRDQALARFALAAQVRLMRAPEGRGASRLVRRDLFRLALELRRLLGPLRPVDPDPLPAWERLSGEAHAGGGGGSPPRRGRRRGRRGGRRRREARLRRDAGAAQGARTAAAADGAGGEVPRAGEPTWVDPSASS
jgi:poly(A) polymerase